jgi:hypothetical protein
VGQITDAGTVAIDSDSTFVNITLSAFSGTQGFAGVVVQPAPQPGGPAVNWSGVINNLPAGTYTVDVWLNYKLNGVRKGLRVRSNLIVVQGPP